MASRALIIVPAGSRASCTGGRGVTVKVAQRRCGSGVPPRWGRACHRTVRGHRGTASRRDAAPTRAILRPGWLHGRYPDQSRADAMSTA